MWIDYPGKLSQVAGPNARLVATAVRVPQLPSSGTAALNVGHVMTATDYSAHAGTDMVEYLAPCSGLLQIGRVNDAAEYLQR